jgi:hypothetical protein
MRLSRNFKFFRKTKELGDLCENCREHGYVWKIFAITKFYEN